MLLHNLEELVLEINQQAFPGNIWVDGSVLTEKLDPDDVDLVLMITTETVKNMSSTQLEYCNYLKETKLYNEYRIDNYIQSFNTDSLSDDIYAYWLRQFDRSRGNIDKGILVIPVPFAV